jgi:membrane fusion protein, multidrug efflux system
MTRQRRWLAVCAVVALAAIAGLTRRGRAASRAAAQKPAPPPVTVVTAVVRQGDLPVALSALGTVTALHTVTVRSRVDGQLERVLFKEGQIVREGDLLATIDPRPFQVQLAEAEGQQAKDEALLANARMDLDRYRDLVGKDAIPHQQLDTQAALVRQYEAGVGTDRAQADAVRLSLGYCRITAPLGGRIGLRLVDAGNMVHAADTAGLAVITTVQPIAVVFSLPEDDLPRLQREVRQGGPVPVEAYDREERVRLALGSVLTLDNEIDPATGTVRVKALFANTDGALFPNQFVNVHTRLDTVHGASVVPSAAIQRGPDASFVYVVRPDGTAARRNVTPGIVSDDQAAVQSGLAPGERVVVDGFDRLQDGQHVKEAANRTSAP